MFYNYFDSLQLGAGKSFFNQINSKDSFNLQDIFDALKSSLDLEIPTELPTEIIRVLNSAIRKVNLNKGITINGNTDKEVQKIFIRLIDQHNSFEGYSKSKHSINNAVVSRIKQVISDPTSQILANSPVDVQS